MMLVMCSGVVRWKSRGPPESSDPISPVVCTQRPRFPGEHANRLPQLLPSIPRITIGPRPGPRHGRNKSLGFNGKHDVGGTASDEQDRI